MPRANCIEYFRSRDAIFPNLPEPAEPRETVRSAMLHCLYLSPSKKLTGARSEPCGNPKFLCSWVLTFRTVLAIVAKLFGSHSAGQGGRSSLTTDTMCQNPFETIRPYSSPNG